MSTMDAVAQSPTDPITELITTYRELNSPTISVVSGSISALEFMRFVACNRPFVIRGGAADWEATQSWNVDTLKELLEGQSVNVAVTPEGYVILLYVSFDWERSRRHS
jgi:peptidyl-lysine (3S)-dioxygenase / protease